MLRTPLTALLGIRYPIIQGGMAWVSDAALASAVSNAGGLGIIAGANRPADQIRAEIRKAKERTDKPFGLNIMLMSPHAADLATVAVEEKIAVVTTGAGNPAPYISAWKEAGIKVLPVVPSVALARRMEKYGADAIIAEGGESGGHVGDLTTMALVPQVASAVSIPVIAAGGIGDGRGLAASLMLGAVGVQLGTAFLVAKECTIHPNYKKKVLGAGDIDTIVSGKRLGHPVRSIKNPFSRAFFQKEYDSNLTNEELEAFGIGALRLAAVEGDLEKGSFLAGQIAGMIHEELPACDIIQRMVDEAEAILKGACQWLEN